MSNRQRLDEALVAAGLAASRSRAKRLILAGQVRVDGSRVDKPGTALKQGAALEVEQQDRYVSRGGDKLAGPLEAAGIEPTGRVALDIGASTGGFTDCLLQAGAAEVVAVDVGYGQLAWSLRQDPRVHVLDRTNARYLGRESLPELSQLPDLLVMDVSFIGVAKVLPAVTALLAPSADALVLVKPQFESSAGEVERGGVVRRGAVRRQALARVAAAAAALGWSVVGAFPSPLRGPAGNWECFLHLRLDQGATDDGRHIAELDVPDDTAARAQP